MDIAVHYFWLSKVLGCVLLGALCGRVVYKVTDGFKEVPDDRKLYSVKFHLILILILCVFCIVQPVKVDYNKEMIYNTQKEAVKLDKLELPPKVEGMDFSKQFKEAVQ